MISKICECGFIVEGVNEAQLQQNIQTHQKTKKHKKQIKLKLMLKLKSERGGKLQ